MRASENNFYVLQVYHLKIDTEWNRESPRFEPTTTEMQCIVLSQLNHRRFSTIKCIISAILHSAFCAVNLKAGAVSPVGIIGLAGGGQGGFGGKDKREHKGQIFTE